MTRHIPTYFCPKIYNRQCWSNFTLKSTIYNVFGQIFWCTLSYHYHTKSVIYKKNNPPPRPPWIFGSEWSKCAGNRPHNGNRVGPILSFRYRYGHHYLWNRYRYLFGSILNRYENRLLKPIPNIGIVHNFQKNLHLQFLH